MSICILAISGKRKSGKDYCTRILKEEFERRRIKVATTGISHSLKEEYAKIHDLNFDELLTCGPYKEKYRKDMIMWGEDVRSRDASVFCRAAIHPFLSSDVIIVSDCRRPSDYQFFTTNYRTLTLRIETSPENRVERGFQFAEGVDDSESECGLDDYHFDVVLNNLTGEEEDLKEKINEVVERVMKIIVEE